MDNIEKKAAFKIALQGAKNMEEVLKIWGDFYDLPNAKLSYIGKITLINNIDMVINLTSCKLK